MTHTILRLICPNLRCRRILAVPPTARGKVVRCGRCGTSVAVPTAGASSDSPAAVEPSLPDETASEAHRV